MNPARSIAARIVSTVARAVEGAYRPGPYWLPVTGGWLPDGAPVNWWQFGYRPLGPSGRTAMVEACISAYSQTIAMCPGDHCRTNNKGGRERCKTSALSRLLRYPNDYQSASDFMLNLVRWLYSEGNAYAYAERNARYEVDQLHLMNPFMSRPYLGEDLSVFYRLAGNEVVTRRIGAQIVAPQRDVLHIRLHNRIAAYPRPLLGETPLLAATNDIACNEAITMQQAHFYNNQARPSAVLSTDLTLDKDQVQALRDRWNEQTRMLMSGGTPIMTAGLKVQPWGVGGKDAQLAEVLKMSDEHIALVFRIPLQMFGLGGTAFSSTEVLMQSWIASGLGFALNQIETAIDAFFGLAGEPDEYCEFNTHSLLRSNMKDRIEFARSRRSRRHLCAERSTRAGRTRSRRIWRRAARPTTSRPAFRSWQNSRSAGCACPACLSLPRRRGRRRNGQARIAGRRQ